MILFCDSLAQIKKNFSFENIETTLLYHKNKLYPQPVQKKTPKKAKLRSQKLLRYQTASQKQIISTASTEKGQKTPKKAKLTNINRSETGKKSKYRAPTVKRK